MVGADREWLEAKGVKVKFRASLEDDCAAMEAIKPDLAIGTTPVVQKAKELGIPGPLLHQPHLGPPADGSGRRRLAAGGGQRRHGQQGPHDHMKAFFEGVGEGETAGVWEGDPNLRPEFRATHLKKLEKKARAAKAEEMI
jgi:3,8-divinyl chlorophyllide a/chlorophyllide a reductase subunit Y